ncbi:LytTR family DNA-binding domain-containing protein [Bacillus sp. E214]|uniref:LytTR family DNA-binding domain-containing protein n=1 Tax=Bacillus sp. E214 TaxID=2587156 RepID=UPI0011DF6F9C|nr:LytTR family DNA-binding domain-containing protein [Bacillus sp. E214]
MRIEIQLDSECTDPKIVIHASEMTNEISSLLEKLSGNEYQSLMGYKGDEILLIQMDDILRIYTEGQYVYAQVNNEKLRLRQRLYQLEEMVPRQQFIRISNSEIVNFEKVKSLDMSISGTITLKFNTGDQSYVSRRYINKIKKHLGI